MSRVPPHLARLAGAPGRPLGAPGPARYDSRPDRPDGPATPDMPVAADPEVAATRRTRSLGRLVARAVRVFGRLVLAG